MKLTHKIINLDWQTVFPILTQYTPSTLFLKTEIGIWGLRFFKSYNDGPETSYEVYLEVLPLWNENGNLNIGGILYQLLNANNLQFSFFYRSHNYLFPQAVKCARLQFGAILKKEISVSDFFAVMQTISSSQSYRPLPYTSILEYELAIALYLNVPELTDIVKTQIEETIRHWDNTNFQYLFNMTIEEWKLSLYERFSSRESFMKQVEINIAANKKLSKLKEAHLIWKPEMAEIIREQNRVQATIKRKHKDTLFERLNRFLHLFPK